MLYERGNIGGKAETMTALALYRKAAQLNEALAFERDVVSRDKEIAALKTEEFLSQSQKQNAAFARLVNGTPVLVPLSTDAIDKSYVAWGLNLEWLAGPGGNLISSFIGYEQTFGKTGFKSDRFTAGVKVPF